MTAGDTEALERQADALETIADELQYQSKAIADIAWNLHQLQRGYQAVHPQAEALPSTPLSGWHTSLYDHETEREDSARFDGGRDLSRSELNEEIAAMRGDSDRRDTDRLRPQCFNPNCGETFDSVDEMVAVPGRGGRSPRHFCEPCAEQIRRGPPLTDGGRSSSGKYRWQCPECGAIVRSSDRPVSCDKCGAKTTLEWHGRVIPDGGVFEDDTDLCDLCQFFEAEVTEEVESDSGETTVADLCIECRDKGLDYQRGEDVDFSTELRLNRRAVDSDTEQSGSESDV